MATLNVKKISAHFSDRFWEVNYSYPFSNEPVDYDSKKDGEYVESEIDEYFFHHQPTSFFTVDSRIPSILRNLISEAEGCRNMTFMIGASGALRKAIYEFLKIEEAQGAEYDQKIKWLKTKYPKVDTEYFDGLSGIQGMTSMELHEQDGSFVPWGRADFDYFMQVVKDTFYEVYVQPKLNEGMRNKINVLLSKSSLNKAKEKGS